jgi:hypothetical protein
MRSHSEKKGATEGAAAKAPPAAVAEVEDLTGAMTGKQKRCYSNHDDFKEGGG